MSLNLVKLCVGIETIDGLADRQKSIVQSSRSKSRKSKLYHPTYQAPKRQSELLDGGSLYWVIKGVITVRQRIVGFEDGTKKDGSRCCFILLDKKLIPVRPTRRRAFQGWRYLPADDAPPDLSYANAGNLAAMPAKMRRELAELALI